MELKSVALLAVMTAVMMSSSVSGEMIARCVLDGTELQYHCPGAIEWYIGSNRVDDGTPPLDILTLNASLETFSSPTIILCYVNQFKTTSLIIQGNEDPGVPLTITATPYSKTSLLLEWNDPFLYGNTTYTVVVRFGDGEVMTMETSDAAAVMEFEGKECQSFQANVSMPGNCYPSILTGTVFVDPLYPKPKNFVGDTFENKTALLTWTQPENQFNDDTFTYILMAIATDGLIEEREVTLDPTVSPVEVFNLSSLEVCTEVLFTLLQYGDCREQQVTTFIPIIPGVFLSELKANVLFSSTGELETVELKFKPPRLCAHQLRMGNYFLTITNGTTTWTEGPNELESSVVFFDRHKFTRDSLYNVTATVVTQHGNISSSTYFNTISPISQEQLDQDSLMLEYNMDSNIVKISWGNPSYSPCNYFVYVVSVVETVSEERVKEETIVVARNTTPHVVFNAGDYLCQELKVSVQIFNTHVAISKLIQLPIYPVGFERNVTADTYMVDGKIKELEVAFIPPLVCEFQRVSYRLEFSPNNEMWSQQDIDITGLRSVVKMDIEDGFVVNINYTLIVTVLVVGYDNFTSSDSFMFPYQAEDSPSTTYHYHLSTSFETTPLRETPGVGALATTEEEPLSSQLTASIGGTIAALVIIVCLAIGVTLGYIKRRRRQVMLMKTGIKPNVTNPIYETGDDVYEELPDPGKHYVNDGTYTDVAPPLPSARYDHLPPILQEPTKPTEGKQDSEQTTTPIPKHEKMVEGLTVASSGSCGALSVHSAAAEDNYTVMNPAGTMTIVPRSRASGVCQWEAPSTGE